MDRGREGGKFVCTAARPFGNSIGGQHSKTEAMFDVSGRGRVTPGAGVTALLGVTLMELVIALVLLGFLAAMIAPSAWRWGNRWRVHRAATELAAFYHGARQSAILNGRPVRVEFGVDSLRAILEGPPDSVVLALAGPARHGATLSASRPVIEIEATGFGWGAANTTLVIRRGSAQESLTTSRLGRLKRW